MAIGSYPFFYPLEKDDQDAFEETFRAYPPQISEFTFSNLFSWRHAYKFSAARLDGFLIVRSDRGASPEFLPPLGAGDAAAVVDRILEDTRGSFIRVPQSLRDVLKDNPRRDIREDPDNSDYLFKTAELISLAGRKYDGKRNLIRKFKSGRAYEYIVLKPDNLKECLMFQERWCALKNCESVEGLRREQEAIREMCGNFFRFGLAGGAIKISGEVYAAAVGQMLNPETLVMHVLKANPDIPGLYQTMFNEYLRREAASFPCVNMEQDLGIEGLRKAKQSYHPLRMIKKYTVCPRRERER